MYVHVHSYCIFCTCAERPVLRTDFVMAVFSGVWHSIVTQNKWIISANFLFCPRLFLQLSVSIIPQHVSNTHLCRLWGFMVCFSGLTICSVWSPCVGFVVPLLVQVVPQGIESVNGSDVNMGCASPLVDSGGVMVCGNTSDYATSYLLDGNSPTINTSTSDWASQLVTVRKNDAGRIMFDHVVLTFGFDTAVTLTSIEVDLFLCPEWNIGAPLIAVYADESRDLVLTAIDSSPLGSKFNQPSQSSCDSLSTVSIPFRGAAANSSYLTVHITVQMSQYSVEWVHVGEVRFLGRPTHPQTTSISTSSTSNPPSGML